MDIVEFSNTFDTLLSSYSNKSETGEDKSRYDLAFDEYEKSLFLTRAQELVVLDRYSQFENNEEMRKSLLNLIVTKEFLLKDTLSITGNDRNVIASIKYDEMYKYQIRDFVPLVIDTTTVDRLLYILEEHCKMKINDCNGKEVQISVQVSPVRLDDLNKTLNNPFKCPSNRKICRIMTDNKIVLYYKPIKEKTIHYFITYLKKPNPIILCSLENVNIDGFVVPQEIETDESLHYNIVEKAVELAIKSKLKGNNN